MLKTRGNTLASTLIVIAIIGILAVVYFMPKGGQSTRKDGKGTTTPGATMMKAKDTQCRNNLDQIRQLIYVQVSSAGDDPDSKPQSLDQISGLPTNMRNCPIGKEAYEFDGENQKVTCPHPGHENY